MARLTFCLLLIALILNTGCSGSHSIQCIKVDGQKVCFVREVWGFNGDRVSLTTSDNVCHKPSKENDYISNSMRSQEVIFAKIADGKFYVYAESMDAPKNSFPVEVVLEEYNPATYFGRDFIKEGYQEFDLSKKNMTWCFNDIF